MGGREGEREGEREGGRRDGERGESNRLKGYLVGIQHQSHTSICLDKS